MNKNYLMIESIINNAWTLSTQSNKLSYEDFFKQFKELLEEDVEKSEERYKKDLLFKIEHLLFAYELHSEQRLDYDREDRVGYLKGYSEATRVANLKLKYVLENLEKILDNPKK